MASAIKSALPTHLRPNSGDEQGNERRHGKTRSHMAFENTSTNVAAAQMRNALTNLAETVKDPEQKKASPSTRNM
ncbi:utp-glucose-1-phosphate uridylyltransferase [Fusarium mundagurra]|uniref:Utp-glucose-1-phosphate uridylyltransferase n=1 Tax=Fusarium mundagurra TaxID=1567541 RepID=A0A8H6DJE7_9HYPO|nr:utp-glucose-1-phosphate uridylyltransferase [Fusarium mundagurra]